MITSEKLREKVYQLLPCVKTPGQYLGGERHSVCKPATEVQTRLCLSFPDVYAIGMSNHGFKLLYEIVNDCDDLACERAFTPWPDMATLMREHQVPLFTLESFQPVRDCDLWGFSVHYELAWTNVLEMLDLAGVALRAAERTDADPLIMAGGYGVYNPEPAADFLDLVVVGEGEQILPALMRYEAQLRHQQLDRWARIAALAQHFEAVYAPGLYNFQFHPDGRIAAIQPQANARSEVKAAIVNDLDQVPAGVRPLVPLVEVTHDRIMLEIMRGCTHGCRFCQAGMVRRPLRMRSATKILAAAWEAYQNTGYNEISLQALSCSDYPGIGSLVEQLATRFNPARVNISLPSLRVNDQLVIFPQWLSTVRKSTLTMAPEVAVARLQRVINKDIDFTQLLSGIEDAYAQGWQTVKLYFMIGLPTEEPDDLVQIVKLAEQASRLGRRYGRRTGGVTLSIASFVPKAHTPFQWAPMASAAQLQKAQQIIKQTIRNRKVHLKFHHIATSQLEGVMARGDRRLGQVILHAWQHGARFDGWQEHFKPLVWEAAFEHAGLKPEFYLQRQRHQNEIFPWEIISSGVSKDYLWQEWQRAQAGQLTPNCAWQACQQCGLEPRQCQLAHQLRQHGQEEQNNPC